MKSGIAQLVVALAATALIGTSPATAAAQTVRDRYEALQARGQAALAQIAQTAPDGPASTRDAVIRRARSVVASYEAFVRGYHSSGYADNALWNAAAIADALFARFNRTADRTAAAHYRRRLILEYPRSSLVKQAKVARPPASPASEPRAQDTPAVSPAPEGKAVLTSIERTVLPEAVRITLSLDREVAYHEERLAGPDRVFFDLKDVHVAPDLRDGVLRYGDDAVRQIRVGRHPDSTVRVVLDLEGIETYSVFTLYNPFRVVVDCEPASARPTTGAGSGEAGSASVTSEAAPPTNNEAPPAPVAAPQPKPTIESRATVPVSPSAIVPAAVAPPIAAAAIRPEPMDAPVVKPEPAAATPPPPAAPRSNSAGGFSLSRQLGLGTHES